MAYIVMASIAMAYIVMVYTVMAPYSDGLYSHCLHSYGPTEEVAKRRGLTTGHKTRSRRRGFTVPNP